MKIKSPILLFIAIFPLLGLAQQTPDCLIEKEKLEEIFGQESWKNEDTLRFAQLIAEKCDLITTYVNKLILKGYNLADSNDKEARHYARKALHQARLQLEKDSTSVTGNQAGYIYFYLGLINYQESKFYTAIQQLNTSLNMWEGEIPHDMLQATEKNIALSYKRLVELRELIPNLNSKREITLAKNWFHRNVTTSLNVEDSDTFELARSYLSLGILNRKQENMDSTMYYLKKGKSLCDTYRSNNFCPLENWERPICQEIMNLKWELDISFGKVMILKNKLKEALANFLSLQESIEPLQDSWSMVLKSYATYYEGLIYEKQEKKEQAYQTYQQALKLAKKDDLDPFAYVEILDGLSRLSKDLGYNQSSLEYSSQLDDTRSELLALAFTQSDQLQLGLEREVVNTELALENEKIRNQYFVTSIIVVVLLFLILILFIRNKNTKRILEKEAIIKKKESEIITLFENAKARAFQARLETIKDIAYEIHNSWGQSIFALSFGLATLRKKINQKEDGIEQDLDEFEELLANVKVEPKAFSRSLEHESLKRGLQTELKTLSSSFGKGEKPVAIIPKIEISDNIEIPPKLEFNLFRIIQQAVTNAITHGKADQIKVYIYEEKNKPRAHQKIKAFLSLTITDNGLGFNQDEVRNGLGLKSMREITEKFNGKFLVESKEEGGTTLNCIFPILK
ncbi:MAG: ATP-binding protein [Bacteroidota bacterium]